MIVRCSKDIPDEPVSHNSKVRKRVWLRQGGSENITQIARAVFPPGELCAAHFHPDMWEMFIVENGIMTVCVESQKIVLSTGDSLLVEPNEVHEFQNASNLEVVLSVISWTASK